MRDDRVAFLLKKQQLGIPFTDDERRELAATPEFVGERDENGNFVGGVMVVPRRLTGSHEDQLRAFAQMMNSDGSPPTAEQVEAFVAGQPIRVESPMDSPPGTTPDEWADDAEPQPVEQQPAPVVESAGPDAPVGNDAVKLPPGHTYVRTLPDGKIVAMFKDESAPRSPARQVILDPKRLRKQRAQSARAAMTMKRAGDAGGRKLSF